MVVEKPPAVLTRPIGKDSAGFYGFGSTFKSPVVVRNDAGEITDFII